MENGEDDRISALPDSLLLEVLFRLPFTEDAIRTGALSKRWEHLWTLVPTLIFSFSDHRPNLPNPESVSNFAFMVDKTLSRCRQLKLKKFKVHTLYDIRFESQFRNWIRFAVNCKVEELNLRFRKEKGEFLLDQFLFINSNFTDLTLASCKLNPTGAISWENLRSLCICRVNIDEDLLVNIISGSPLLETLVLGYCKWPHIPSEFESDKIEISAPTSLSLTQCRDLKHLKKFKLCINDDIESHPQINNSIHYAIRCNIKELNLEFWREEAEFVLDQYLFINSCFTGLRLAECKLNPSGAISWKNLRSLSIYEVYIDEDLLVNIFSGSPLLETLVLNKCKWPDIDKSKSESEADMIEISAPTSLSLTQCHQLQQLKTLKLLTLVGFHPQISNLICYAIRCNVKELNLEFWDMYSGYEFMIDQILFTRSCFTQLTLNGCKLNPIGAISWKSLRFLCLFHYMNLDEDLIENILSGSPVLETLELNDCYGYRRLDITSKSVKNLVLYGYKVSYDESEDDIIEINAPHILSLTIDCETLLSKLLLLKVSSLVNVYLDYTYAKFEHLKEMPSEKEQEMLTEYIMNLRHVKELNLGFYVLRLFLFCKLKVLLLHQM